jgi:hypothetical protein
MSNSVTKYQIVSSSDRSKVVQQMQDYIAAGWQPWGSLSASSDGVQMVYTQAIVRYETDTGPENT